jgi:antitoxin component YwqK of YwqJK toxin-antitoxin module
LIVKKIGILLLYFAYQNAFSQNVQKCRIDYTYLEISALYEPMRSKNDILIDDSTCVAYNGGSPFSGYLKNKVYESGFELFLYENGIYTGNRIEFMSHDQFLTYRLYTKESPTDTNKNIIKIQNYYRNGQLKMWKFERINQCLTNKVVFDVIFGGSDLGEYCFKEFYENGNLKFDYSGGNSCNFSLDTYFENGQLNEQLEIEQCKPKNFFLELDETGQYKKRIFFKDGIAKRGFILVDGRKQRVGKVMRLERKKG